MDWRLPPPPRRHSAARLPHSTGCLTRLGWRGRAFAIWCKCVRSRRCHKAPGSICVRGQDHLHQNFHKSQPSHSRTHTQHTSLSKVLSEALKHTSFLIILLSCDRHPQQAIFYWVSSQLCCAYLPLEKCSSVLDLPELCWDFRSETTISTTGNKLISI